MHELCGKTLDKASTNKVARVFLHSALCAEDHWIDKQRMATDVLALCGWQIDELRSLALVYLDLVFVLGADNELCA